MRKCINDSTMLGLISNEFNRAAKMKEPNINLEQEINEIKRLLNRIKSDVVEYTHIKEKISGITLLIKELVDVSLEIENLKSCILVYLHDMDLLDMYTNTHKTLGELLHLLELYKTEEHIDKLHTFTDHFFINGCYFTVERTEDVYNLSTIDVYKRETKNIDVTYLISKNATKKEIEKPQYLFIHSSKTL